MVPKRVIEGTGEEIAKYAKEHPTDHFQLVILEGEAQVEGRKGPGTKSWDELMEYIHSIRGQMVHLPLEATSTDALYD